jgi:hypothetical protein
MLKRHASNDMRNTGWNHHFLANMGVCGSVGERGSRCVGYYQPDGGKEGKTVEGMGEQGKGPTPPNQPLSGDGSLSVV